MFLMNVTSFTHDQSVGKKSIPSVCRSLQRGSQFVTMWFVSSKAFPQSLHSEELPGLRALSCFRRKLCPVISCTNAPMSSLLLLSKLFASWGLNSGYHNLVWRHPSRCCHLRFHSKRDSSFICIFVPLNGLRGLDSSPVKF